MNYRKIALKENFKSSSSLLDELLSTRNIEEKQIKSFLNPTRSDFISPFAFLDMKKAVDRIQEAIDKKQKILIFFTR